MAEVSGRGLVGVLVLVTVIIVSMTLYFKFVAPRVA